MQEAGFALETNCKLPLALGSRVSSARSKPWLLSMPEGLSPLAGAIERESSISSVFSLTYFCTTAYEGAVEHSVATFGPCANAPWVHLRVMY